jgi:hypothetical protein
MMDMIRPEYYVVGTAKAGTTSLFRYFLDHPQVFVPSNKETYFFGKYCYEDSKIETIQEYQRIFSSAARDDKCVEVSTSYLYSKTAASEIKEYNPDAKIIIILRNPVDRAFSNYKYKLKTGKENCFNFEDAVSLEKSRISEGAPYGFHYINMGLYFNQVKRYIDIFDKDNLLILLFDELKTDPELFYQKITDFMGIESLADFNVAKKFNKSGKIRSKILMRILNGDNIFKRLVKKIVPQDKQRHVSGFLKDLNISKKKNIMRIETKSRLKELFHDDIKKLEACIDRDLSSWLNS